MFVKPVCVKCQCFYRPEHNGHFFTEMMPRGDTTGTTAEERRGTKMPHLWKPYKIWLGDLWKCPECGHELVVGVVGGPASEHYKPGFQQIMDGFNAGQLKVNDC